ncbi:MAG: acyl-CoA dehydrogenase family protein [Spirochaetota bacterium]
MSESSSLGFLEHLYREGYHDELYRQSGAQEPHRFDRSRIDDFLERFRKAVSDLEGNDRSEQDDHRIAEPLMNRFKEIGFFGLNIPEQYGGLGLTMSEYLAVVAEAAQSDLSYTIVPLAHLSIGVKGVLLFGTDEQKERLLPKAASGEMVFAYSLTEARHGSDAQHIETHAEPDESGDFYVLNGSKTYVTNGNYADAYTVFCRLGKAEEAKLIALVVDRDAEGVWVGKDIPKMGLHMSSTAALRFKDVRVPKENLLGDEGEGFKVAMSILNYGRLGLAAASAGLMHRSAADMLDRATDREQFGRKIVDFELIREKIARARAHALGAEGIMYFTARLLERDARMNVAIESSHAKLYGTTRCWDTLYDAMQVAGGAGYLRTMPYEKRMRDFRVTTIFEGTTEIHSMYPALTIARGLSERLGRRGALGKLFELIRFRRARELRAIKPNATPLAAAIRSARRGEAIVRRLVAKAVTKYRRGVTEREFVLRRITTASLSVYVLLGAVSHLERTYGERAEIPERELASLAYLKEEADELFAAPLSVENTRLERATHRLVESMPGS